MEFQACAIKHAEPVTYCTNCIEHIIGETIAYRNFTGDDTCRAIYVDSDRLNIIETTYENSKNLWNAGSCAGKQFGIPDHNFSHHIHSIQFLECFNCNINDNPANCTQTNTTIEFLTLTVAWMNCTANTNKNTCLDCKDDYENINIMYDQMRRKRGEKICFDLEDSVSARLNDMQINWTISKSSSMNFRWIKHASNGRRSIIAARIVIHRWSTFSRWRQDLASLSPFSIWAFSSGANTRSTLTMNQLMTMRGRCRRHRTVLLLMTMISIRPAIRPIICSCSEFVMLT